MNKKTEGVESDSYKSLRILEELSNDVSVTQRELSQRLGIALGLVNSYVKNLVAKGYITVKAIPHRRYAYYLTPKGFAEKTRLAFDMFQDYTRIYRQTRTNLRGLFKEMQESGLRKVVFAGVDEVAEIAYITLQETDLELIGVVDPDRAGEKFFGKRIMSVEILKDMDNDGIVVTSYLKRDEVFRDLINHGIEEKNIRTIFEMQGV